MGYTVAMFAILLLTSAVIITAANYGIAKDSQVTPLQAENIYAGRETGKAQTGLTIVTACLGPEESSKRYLSGQGSSSISGPHTLSLFVRNNGSTILKPSISTVLYNTSYVNFTVTNWDKDDSDKKWDSPTQYDLGHVCRDEDEDNGGLTVWTPLSYICMKVSNIYIPTPDSPAPGTELRLLVTAENGVSTIAPTSPINFTGRYSSNNYIFSWNASYDEDGIAYYRIYGLKNNGDLGDCHHYDTFQEIPGNATTASVPCSSCSDQWFYITAVDKLQNEGVQSRTLKCNSGSGCSY